MSVKCPYCDFTMLIRGAKPGRYTPSCQQCKKKFLIEVHAAANQPATVKTFETAMAEMGRGGEVAAVLEIAEHRAVVVEKVEHELATHVSAVKETMAPGAPGVAGGTANVGEHHGAVVPHVVREREHKRSGPSKPLPDLTGQLGGYLIERKLGEGGMGAVYLAKQVSLDRPVAVKVMNPAWANDPTFIARFTREAYAAAQLTHHNVVQIYDIGIERDMHYFSMEYVAGKTLSQLVEGEGRLDPEVAAGYTLQAARGLKFAHDHGMIHRDVKPENLLLNEQGIVKVLDLGLVKTPEKERAAARSGDAPVTGMTQMNVSMGTPAYMSPEQALAAGSVDQRADVYSLGCTLYDLVVGKPPFEGKTVLEVLTKHASEPVTPPEVLVKRVPASLSHIVQKMVAKRKEQRYGSMEGVIKELEDFLGINSTGPFSPKEEHATLLEGAVAKFNKAGMAVLRKNLLRGAVVVELILMVLLVMWGRELWAGTVAGLLVLTAVSYQVVVGVVQRTHVFTRVRQLAFGAQVVEWLKVAGILGLVVLVLWIFGLLWIWVGVAVVAVGIGLLLAVVVDPLVRKQRKPAVEEVQGMLKGMRLKGLEEDALRQFVCKYSGRNWEEFFESLFGYEAKMAARAAWGRGDEAKGRKKFGAWRDGIIAWAEGRMKQRQEDRERRLLEKLEEKSLRSRGASQEDAKRKAKEATDWMVGQATHVREEKKKRGAETAGAIGITGPAVSLRFGGEMSEADHVAAKRERARVKAARGFGGGVGLKLLGPHVRLGLGVIGIAVCLLWLHQNDSLHADEVRAWVDNNVHGAFHDVAEPWKDEKIGSTAAPELKLKKKMAPLNVPMVTGYLSGEQRWQLLNSLSWGVAGVLLVLSAFWRGVKISFFVIPAAVVMVAGEFLGVPGLMGFDGWQVSYLIGGVLAFLGFWRGKELA